MERVILLPTMDAVLALRKRLADGHSPESFSSIISTERAWASNLWEAYGDNRRIASSAQRGVALGRSLELCGSDLSKRGGVAKVVGRFISEALGTRELDGALSDCSALAESAVAILTCVEAYERVLSEAGLVDLGRAWQVLSGERVLGKGCDVELRGIGTAFALRQFLESQDAHIFDSGNEAPVISRAKSGIEVRFAFPSGCYARPSLICDFVQSLPEGGTLAITTPCADELYRELAPRLASRGIPSACRASVAFCSTDFGRALFCVERLVLGDSLDICAAADYALNPFSRMEKQEAFDFAASLRGNRLIGRDECLSMLREASRTFEYFEELLSAPDAVEVAGVFEDVAHALSSTGERYVREQILAIGKLRDIWIAASETSAMIETCLSVLRASFVDVSRCFGEADPRVVVQSMGQLADGGPNSFDWVMLAGMTSANYPLKESHDAADGLLSMLGLNAEAQALPRARREFSDCVLAARKGVVIERCLNDENAAPTYPAAVVQEFVDCYRKDPTDLGDIDNAFSLPEQLQVGMLQRGEEALYENESVMGGAQSSLVRVPKPNMGRVSDALQEKMILPRVGKGGVVVSQPCFSASQIENYLECPQKWFALRRLRLDELDEGFGAKEMGDFSHSVLEDFYKRFQSDVAPKVSGETLPEARDLMRVVLEEHEAAQCEMKPLSNRLVAITQLERREMADLKRKLVDFLDHEAELLPGFHPAYFEFEIPSVNPVEYAGHLLMGKIDRIDVDDRGRAVIIDYKSALSQEYDLYEGEKQGGAMRQGKVQALIYAQAIRRMLGLEVIGALYVCYGRSHAVSGALDKSIEPLHVPGLRADRCVYKGELGPEFSDLLDATESRVASALEHLLAGEVPACANHASACTFCPEISCPQRGF